MERIARRFDHSMACVSWLPVSEFGDPDHRFGFLYDERDGTGLDHRPALAVDPGNRRGADYIFLKFAHRDNCQSAPTRPGTPGSPGTADPAKLRTSPSSSIRSRVRALERRLENLERRAKRLDGMSERFDEWESCLSWVPVTEYGDPDGGFGYRFRSRGPSRPTGQRSRLTSASGTIPTTSSSHSPVMTDRSAIGTAKASRARAWTRS